MVTMATFKYISSLFVYNKHDAKSKSCASVGLSSVHSMPITAAQKGGYHSLHNTHSFTAGGLLHIIAQKNVER